MRSLRPGGFTPNLGRHQGPARRRLGPNQAECCPASSRLAMFMSAQDCGSTVMRHEGKERDQTRLSSAQAPHLASNVGEVVVGRGHAGRACLATARRRVGGTGGGETNWERPSSCASAPCSVRRHGVGGARTLEPGRPARRWPPRHLRDHARAFSGPGPCEQWSSISTLTGPCSPLFTPYARGGGLTPERRRPPGGHGGHSGALLRPGLGP